MSVAERLKPEQTSASKPTGWTLSGCLPPNRVLSTVMVTGPTFTVGRRPDADLQLASMCVSSSHAEILQIGKTLFIRDLGSTNGTYVNRNRIKQPTPLCEGDHIQIADIEFQLRAPSTMAKAPVFDQKKTAAVMDSLEADWTFSQLHHLLSTRAVVPNYQKIINLQTRGVMGYEALARSNLCGLENPGRMFQAAQLVSREAELSIICRQRSAEGAHWMPTGAALFLNTHPHESLDVDVFPSVQKIRNEFPHIELVVEVHEGAIQDPDRMKGFCEEIRSIGAKVAYDDFGAGQSRLLELVKAPPDYLKFDASLIRDIHQASAHQRRMLQFLVQMALDVPTIPLAEGIEKAEEAEVCLDLGFQLAQGYLFGRPVPGEVCVTETHLLNSAGATSSFVL